MGFDMPRRFGCFIMAVLFLGWLCACSTKDGSPVTINLTPGNVDEYLCISFDYSATEVHNSNKGSIYSYTLGAVNVSTRALARGCFNDVCITIDAVLANDWSVYSGDSAYNSDNPQIFTCRIYPQENGAYEETHTLYAGMTVANSPSITYRIVSVSGTFSYVGR